MYWAENVESISDSEFIRVSTFIVSVNIFAAILRSFSFARGCLIAAVNIYDQLISALFTFPMTFFETTSFGQIYNRIGQDTNNVDDQLPFVLNIVLAQMFVIIGTIIDVGQG